MQSRTQPPVLLGYLHSISRSGVRVKLLRQPLSKATSWDRWWQEGYHNVLYWTMRPALGSSTPMTQSFQHATSAHRWEKLAIKDQISHPGPGLSRDPYHLFLVPFLDLARRGLSSQAFWLRGRHHHHSPRLRRPSRRPIPPQDHPGWACLPWQHSSSHLDPSCHRPVRRVPWAPPGWRRACCSPSPRQCYFESWAWPRRWPRRHASCASGDPFGPACWCPRALAR